MSLKLHIAFLSTGVYDFHAAGLSAEHAKDALMQGWRNQCKTEAEFTKLKPDDIAVFPIEIGQCTRDGEFVSSIGLPSRSLYIVTPEPELPGGISSISDYVGLFTARSDGDWDLWAVVCAEAMNEVLCPDSRGYDPATLLNSPDAVIQAISKMLPTFYKLPDDVLCVFSADPDLPSVYEFDFRTHKGPVGLISQLRQFTL